MGSVDDLIGTPFREMNCLRGALAVLRAKGIEAEHPDDVVRRAWDRTERDRDHGRLWDAGWSPVTGEWQDGDVLVMREDDGSETHLGVVDGPGWVVHTTIGTGMVRVRAESIAPRVAAVYRHRSCQRSTRT